MPPSFARAGNPIDPTVAAMADSVLDVATPQNKAADDIRGFMAVALAKRSPSDWMKFFACTASSKEYLEYLAGEIPTEKPLPDSSECAEVLATTTLRDLPYDVTRATGTRCVAFDAMKDLMFRYALQTEWREYDIVHVCRLEDAKTIYYLKFHHRACALHAVFMLYYVEKRSPAAHLVQMASSISSRFAGSLPRMQACAQGLIKTVAMNQAIKLSWLDVVMNIVEEAQLEKELFEKVPEHANALISAGHVHTLSQRIGRQVYDLVEQFLADTGLPRWKLPQQWFRDASCLMRPLDRASKKDHLTSDEQKAVFARFFGSAKQKLMQANVDEMTTIAVGKTLTAEERQVYVTEDGQKTSERARLSKFRRQLFSRPLETHVLCCRVSRPHISRPHIL